MTATSPTLRQCLADLRRDLLRLLPDRPGGEPQDCIAAVQLELVIAVHVVRARVEGDAEAAPTPTRRQLACDTEDMLKFATRMGGMAARLK